MIFDKLFKNSDGEFVNIMDVLFGKEDLTNYIYTLAEAHAIDLIAKTIAKCEIQTFELKDGKIQENKGDLYWTLNFQPNYNENGTKFLYKLTTKLLTNKTALVIIHKKTQSNLLYVADNYNTTNGLLHGKVFTNVEISDDEGNSLKLEKTYNQDNSIYYSLKNTNLQTASENFKVNMAKVLKATQKSFLRANTAKWKLKKPGGQPALQDTETGKPISYEDFKNKITDGIFSDDEAIVLLSDVFDLINLNNDNKKDLTDFEKCVNQIGSSVAQKWSIPLDVFFRKQDGEINWNARFYHFCCRDIF